jgi:CheY-like chemotaxis protein/nitrogen-specific signal transduction histidine kinase
LYIPTGKVKKLINMTDLYQLLFVISPLTGIIGLLIITAMVFLLWKLNKSNAASYENRILSLSQQVIDMQQHLDYANREETKAKADAVRAAATRDKLLTSLSHEIRTPMNGILGMAVLLEETELNPEQRDYMDTIISSGRILLNKVDEVMATEMLEQSRINSSNAIEQKSTDLHNCIEEVIENFAVKAAALNKELLYEIDSTVPMQVLADSKRLQQLLTNLVENVLPAKKQQVYISAQVLKYNNTDRLPALGFTVATEMLGSSVQTEELLAAGSILPDHDHTAAATEETLGLNICQKLVTEMNGEIRSIQGDDTAYIFSIPLEAVPLQFTATEGYSLKDFEGKPVLIVNSNETAAAVLKNKLQQWKLHPVVVTNAEQALQIIPIQSFSLLITEMELPGMNGMELAAAVKNMTPALPVLLLNSNGSNQVTSQEAMAAKIKLLQKPLKQHTLFDSILSALRNKNSGQAQEITVKDLSTAFAKKYPLRILVAEDNPVNQKWAIKILAKLGYQADIADNGHIVLDMVGKTTYDLVLMDVQMPQMDGLEATKMIRVCLNKQPVIIAMTANVMHGDRVACMQAGMDDYISKPVQLVELLNMLEKWALVITEKKNYIQLS